MPLARPKAAHYHNTSSIYALIVYTIPQHDCTGLPTMNSDVQFHMLIRVDLILSSVLIRT